MGAHDADDGHVDDKRDAALGQAILALFSCKKIGTRQPGKAKRIRLGQVFHLVRRLLIVVAAVWYLVVSIQSSVASLKLLRGAKNAPMKFEAYDTNYILKWAGTSTIRKSPFVMQILQNDTTPRPYTLYLDDNDVVSKVNCSTPKFNARLYGNQFLRLAMAGLQRDASFNLTELVTYQIVVPVVDCSYTPLQRGGDTSVRIFYFMRLKTNTDDMMLIAIRFNMQDYKVLETKEFGPFGLANHQYIKDMSQPKVFKTLFTGALGYPFEPASSYIFSPPQLNTQGWWVTNTMPRFSADSAKRVITSSRTGFYVSSDSEQANIKNLYWTIDDDPVTALTKWNWKGEPMLKDSWAWAHLLHAFFALDSVVNLILLLLVVYRNLQQGKFWIGDAFVSVSTTLMVRGVLILVSWGINGFWSVMEFCLHDAHSLAQTQEIFIHPEIMRADLLTLFLAISSLLGYLLRERIDPVFAVVVFEVFFSARRSVVAWYPSAVRTMTAFAFADLDKSVLGVSESVAYSSPLRLWTTHKLPGKDPNFIFACLLPIFSSLYVVVAYVAVRKLYHRVHREKIYKQGSKYTTGTAVSATDDANMVLYKRNLTIFEIATGAELQNRFGVLSDYENCIFIKGMKYASADGIYSNGFVVVNSKFLVASEDLLPIAVQKLLRMRLRNIFAYQVEGNTVQQRARLVYPETLSWNDLTQLSVTVLS